MAGALEYSGICIQYCIFTVYSKSQFTFHPMYISHRSMRCYTFRLLPYDITHLPSPPRLCHFLTHTHTHTHSLQNSDTVLLCPP